MVCRSVARLAFAANVKEIVSAMRSSVVVIVGTGPLLWVTHHGQLAGAIRYGALVSKVDADGLSTRNPIQFDLKFFRGGELAF